MATTSFGKSSGFHGTVNYSTSETASTFTLTIASVEYIELSYPAAAVTWQATYYLADGISVTGQAKTATSGITTNGHYAKLTVNKSYTWNKTAGASKKTISATACESGVYTDINAHQFPFKKEQAVKFTVTVPARKKPVVNGLSVERTNSSNVTSDYGRYARVTYSWNAVVEPTSVVLTVSTNGSTISTRTSQTTKAGGYGESVANFGGNLNPDIAYTFTLTVSDDLYSVSQSVLMPGLYYPIDIRSGGKGVGIGKAATREALDVGMPIYCDDAITAGGDVTDGSGNVLSAKTNTKVKGNAESSYRTGNVNLTPANIGAAAASHSHSWSAITGAPMGTMKESPGASDTLASGTGKSLASISLEKGVWLVEGHAHFAANATGRRMAHISATANKVNLGMNSASMGSVSCNAVSGGETDIDLVRILMPTSTTTYYLNAAQYSGSSLSSCGGYLRAVRIA